MIKDGHLLINEQHRGFFPLSSPQPLLVSTVSKEHGRKLSQHEKFRKASLLTSKLASILSKVSDFHFSHRLKVAEDLIIYWKNGVKKRQQMS